MTEQAENLILEILKKIQADAALFRDEMNAKFDHVEQRFERIDELIRKQRRDVAGILVIGKGAAGQFAEDLAALEKRVHSLEAGQH